MKCSVRRVRGVAILDLSGVLDQEGAVKLRDIINELLDEGQRKILVDLEHVAYMNSPGIGELVACFKRVVERGGSMKLLKPGGKVQDLLTLTRLGEIYETFDSEEAAVSSF